MQQLIDDMKAIPGVIGACTYRSKEGIVDSNLPSLFQKERLHDAARHLAKIHAAGRLNFPDLNEVMINYEESVVVFRQVNANDHLITICDPGINMNLLAMTLNLAIENFTDKSPERDEPAPMDADTAGETKAPRPNVNELLKKGPTARPLQAMAKLLADIIGPMAKIVFEDALVRWVDRSDPKKGSLSKLLEIVCQEIGDEEKSQEYRALVRQRMAAKPPQKKG